MLAAAQGVLGVGIGLLVAVGIAAAGEWPAPHEHPHVLAWAIAGMPAAWIIGMPVVGARRRRRAGAPPGSPSRRSSALVALVLVRLRPPDAAARAGDAIAGAWRRPEVARFAPASCSPTPRGRAS